MVLDFLKDNLFLIIFLCVILFFGWLIVSITLGVETVVNTNKFRKNLDEALKNEDLEWDDVKHLINDSNISMTQCVYVLNKIKTEEIVKGSKTNKRNLIEKYIREINNEDPFEGIPEKIRISLVALKEKGTPGINFEVLVKEIRQVVRKNSKEQLLLKRCTIWGFLISVISILIAIYQTANSG
ncbi:TPA: hypothetical protein NGV86_004644 [Vibrio parahaemolyticus]|nr:hypothetical protein [Vibrio parahaemolyticus]